jgi:hypothetical protein
MVNVPVVTILADVLPLTVPTKALDITATLAGPPRERPATAIAKSLKKAETPVCPERSEHNKKEDVGRRYA